MLIFIYLTFYINGILEFKNFIPFDLEFVTFSFFRLSIYYFIIKVVRLIFYIFSLSDYEDCLDTSS